MATILSSIATWAPTVVSCVATCSATWGPTVYYSIIAIVNVSATDSLKSLHSNCIFRSAKDILPGIFEKVETLRKDILVGMIPDHPFATTCGNNFGSTPVILIHENFETADKDALGFTCKHELSHIHSSDSFTGYALAATLSAISTYTIPFFQSCLPDVMAFFPYCVPIYTGMSVLDIARAIAERRADTFAVHNATSEELIGMERFFRAEIEVNKSLHSKYPSRFTKEGNLRFAARGIAYPPTTERMKKIMLECEKRNIFIKEESEVDIEKMQKLKALHQNVCVKYYKLDIDLNVKNPKEE